MWILSGLSDKLPKQEDHILGALFKAGWELFVGFGFAPWHSLEQKGFVNKSTTLFCCDFP